MLATEDRHGDLLGLRTELFLKDQDIYGRDDAEQDIEDDHHNAVDRARQARDDHAVIELLQPASSGSPTVFSRKDWMSLFVKMPRNHLLMVA